MVVYQSKFMTTNFNKLIKFSDVYFGVDFRSACFLIWQVRACSLFLLIYMRALKLFEFESGGGGHEVVDFDYHQCERVNSRPLDALSPWIHLACRALGELAFFLLSLARFKTKYIHLPFQ